MSFTFLPKEMSDDLVALSRVAATFFSPQSVARIERLANDLSYAVANAKSDGLNGFNWKTGIDEPIQIRESRQWKGGTADFAPLSADVVVDYECSLLDANDRVLAKGVTVIRIRDADNANEKTFHFDAEIGGWTEMHNGTQRGRAGHPAFHIQFYGLVNDLPRIPSIIVHPVDIISSAILELHQKKWRDHVASVKGKSQLRYIPARQRFRIEQMLEGWRQLINRHDHLAIIALQSPIGNPLAL